MDLLALLLSGASLILGFSLGATMTFLLLRLAVQHTAVLAPALPQPLGANLAGDGKSYPMMAPQNEAQELRAEAIAGEDFERYFDSPAGLGRV